MPQHPEFLTEDFQRYVAECKHMASLARRAEGSGQVGRRKWLRPQPQDAVPESVAAAGWAV